MEDINFNKYKESWKKESDKIIGQNKLSDSEIKSFLKGKSKDISRLYKAGLYMDIVIKFILTLACGFLVYIWYATSEIAAFSTGLMIITGVFGAIQLRYLLKFPDFELGENNLKNIINSIISYYSKHYKKALYIGASSAPLFFISGSLYYFYFKYGEIRTFQIDDFIVFGVGIVISYFIAIMSQIIQFRFQMNQLKSCLQEINEDIISELTIQKQKKQRKRLIIIALLFILVGALIFTYILIK